MVKTERQTITEQYLERMRQPTDVQYLELLEHILHNGNEKTDRTGTGTLSVFSPPQLQFDLTHRFPILNTKKIHFDAVAHEVLWFLQGSTNINYLTENNIHIWDEWADENGELGPVYGYQWRNWLGADQTHHDQIADAIQTIKNQPYSRRIMVSAWNVGQLNDMALPPCHILYQFYVSQGQLSCHMYQRSADVFLGLPFNISSYALLTHLVAQASDLRVGTLTISLGDAHLYLNHLDQATTQLNRQPKNEITQIAINPQVKDINQFQFSDIQILNYHPYPAIYAPISV